MENKKLKFGYEDTDKSIEVDLYGIIFEVNNIDNIKELEDLEDVDNSVVETQIEDILGKGAIDKINKKRKDDGYKELDLNIELNILGCIFEAYAKATSENVLERFNNVANNINKNFDNFKTVNRGQIRNYNRNQYRRNGRNYRRYY